MVGIIWRVYLYLYVFGFLFVFVFVFVFVFFELYEVVISRGADTAQKSLSRDNSLHTFTLSHFLWSTGKSTKAMTKYIICQCQRIFSKQIDF